MPEADGGPKNKRWKIGDTVELRSGCLCRVKGHFSASYKDGVTGAKSKAWGWSLECLEHGNRITVWDNGDYSPVTGNKHQLDVVGPATNAAISKMKRRLNQREDDHA